MQPATAPGRKKAVSPAPPRPRPAPFASFHTLLMRVDDVNHVPEKGSAWVRGTDGLFSERAVADLRPEQLAAAVKAGVLYLLWGHRALEFEQLGPEWPRQCTTRQKLNPHRRHLHNGRRPEQPDTDAD